MFHVDHTKLRRQALLVQERMLARPKILTQLLIYRVQYTNRVKLLESIFQVEETSIIANPELQRVLQLLSSNITYFCKTSFFTELFQNILTTFLSNFSISKLKTGVLFGPEINVARP